MASVTNICPGINFNLNLTGSSVASGLSYQWQLSSNNVNFTNINGATSINLNPTQSSSTYYRCIVTCTGVLDSSTSVFVAVNSFATCYCTSAATSTADDDIGNVTFGSLNNGIGTPATANPTSTNTYSDFTALAPQTYLQGLSYPISVTQIDLNGYYTCSIAVFIDYDQNGIFDATTEIAFNGQTIAGAGGNTIAGNVIIPLTSLAGNTGMRVVLTEGTAIPSPCGTYTWGETEDYVVHIMQAPPCTAPPAAGTTLASDTTVCPNVNFNLSLIGSALASGLSYQWQSSPDNITWTNIAGATSLYFQTSQTSNTII